MSERFQRAETLLRELGIREPRDIDLEAIAWMMGAAVRYRPLERCEATIIGSKRRAIITVNSLSIPVRRRFSLAHEIGHWNLHRGRLLFCGREEISSPSSSALSPEGQADQFASELVLPDYMVKPRVARIKRLSLSKVREVAEEFDVSDTATLLKIVSLNQLPIVAVCHSKYGRRWFQRARMVPDWWFPRDELDHNSFAFEMLFGGKAESSHPQKVGAEAWFDFRGVGRFEIQEQSFLLPNDEILTTLTLPSEAIR